MIRLLRAWAVLACVCMATAARAQIITTVPAFPTMDQPVTITFDATQGNAGIANYTQNVYGHIGLVIAGPASTTWTNTVGTWGTADPRTLMTRVAPNLYQITFTPRTFFNVAQNVTGYRLGLLFRSADGNTVGRSSTGGDIFYNLIQPGEQVVRIDLPQNRNLLLAPGASVPLLARTSQQAFISWTANGVTLASSPGADTTLFSSFSSLTTGAFWLKATAQFASSVKADSIRVIVEGAPTVAAVPAGMLDGPNYVGDSSVVLVLAAPGKHNVFVRGDFNNWDFDPAYYMNRTPDSSRFWLRIDHLTPGREYIYQFTIDGSLTVGDPLAEKTSASDDGQISALMYPGALPYPSTKATGIAAVIQPGRAPYVWRHARPAAIPKERLTIYELHLRDFLGRSADKGFKGLTDTLNYLQKLGVTTIELMPISEFEGNQSWGYNPNFHGAIEKSYGPGLALKALIDSVHGRGMQVVLDVVYNHVFDTSPLVQMYPRTSNPYINNVATHDFNVGNDLNHESIYTRAYIDVCNQRLLNDYQVDGFRFDLAKGFTQKRTLGLPNSTTLWGQLDRSRIRNIARIAQVCRAAYPDVLLILEMFADNVEEKIYSDSLNIMIWGNVSGASQALMKGQTVNNDLGWGYYRNRSWVNPNLVTYAESHDEERTMYGTLASGRIVGSYNTRDTATALQREGAFACMQLAQPGPKMLWQFEELGYNFSINRCANGTINGNCRTDPKPVRWDFYNHPYRRNLYNVYKEMLRLRATEPVFSTRNVTVQLAGFLYGRRVILRGAAPADGDAIAIANYDVTAQNSTPNFTRLGRWYEFWSGDSLQVDTLTQKVRLQPGEGRLYSTKRFAPPAQLRLLTGVRENVATAASAGYGLSPNPSTGRLTLNVPEGALTCTLLNITGRTVATYHLARTERELDLAALPGGKPAPGLYMVQVQPAGGRPVSLRLVVE